MKRLLWLLPTLLLLAAAFLTPTLLLSAQIEEYTASRSSVAAPAALEQAENTSLMDNLLLFADKDTQYLYYSLTEAAKAEEIKSAFLQELETLYSTGAITTSMQLMFNPDSIVVSDYYMVNSVSGKTILLQEIFDPSTDSYAIFDSKSGKVMKLLFYLNGANLLFDAENKNDVDATTNYTQQLNAWANYYSLSPEESLFSISSDMPVAAEQSMAEYRDYNALCILADDNGNRVGFTLCYLRQTGSVSWQILSAEDFDYLAQIGQPANIIDSSDEGTP